MEHITLNDCFYEFKIRMKILKNLTHVSTTHRIQPYQTYQKGRLQEVNDDFAMSSLSQFSQTWLENMVITVFSVGT